MMPFSVLRMFGLGLLSWIVLGLGIYSAYASYQQFNEPAYEIVHKTKIDDASLRADQDGDQTVADEALSPSRTVIANEPRWQRWGYLSLAVVCLLWSAFGSLPTRYLLGNSQGATPESVGPIQDRIIDRPDGSQIAAKSFGVASKGTLLLTHGWSLDSSAWAYIRNDLAKQYQVVVWDLAGLGRSKAADNGDQSLEKMAHDLEAVRQNMCNNSNVILVGHSIGGMILQVYARHHSERLGTNVKGMVFLHTTYTNPVKTNMLAWLTEAIQPLLVLLNYLMIPLAPLMWLSNWQSYYNGSTQWVSRWSSFSGKQTLEQLDRGARLSAQAWPAVIARGNLAMTTLNGQDVLSGLTIPALVIAGEHDRLTVPAASEHIHQLVKQSSLQQVNGGHLGYWEVAPQASQHILSFANQVFTKTDPPKTDPPKTEPSKTEPSKTAPLKSLTP